MKRILVSLALLLGLTISVAPIANAETSTQVIAVSVGPLKGCQVTSTDVYCWGNSLSDSLSQDAMPGNSIPSRIIFPREQYGIKFLDLVVGSGFACALFVNNKVYCWGGNNYGVLGAGSNIPTSITPVNIDQTGVLKGKTITEIAASGLTACIIASGAPFCWGSGTRGQLGNGNLGIAFSPSAVLTSGVLSGKTAVSIFAGDSGGTSGGVFCVITDLGAGFCWGGRDSENAGNGSPIGDGNQIGSYYPVAINMSGDLSGKKITYISPGMCLIADEQLFCWGWIQKFFTARFGRVSVYSPTLVSNDATLVGKKIKADEADFLGGCVIADNDLLCWGDNFSDTSTGYNGLRLPRKVPLPNLPKGQLLEKINQTSQNRYCLIASGQSACMGYNSNGELGNGTTVTSWIPIAVNTKALLSASAEKIAEEAKFAAEEAVAKAAEEDAKKEGLKLLAERKVSGFKPTAISLNEIYYDGTEVATAGAKFIAYVDINRDFKSDLITISDTCSGAFLRFGNFFKSTFSTPEPIFDNLRTCHLVSGDYNKDGIVDFVITQGETIEIIVLLGKVDGTFVVFSRYQVGYSLFRFEIFQQDLNLDGNLDLITLNDYSKSIHIFLGQGNGAFKKLDEIKFLSGPNHLTFLDINGDKYPELIINLYDSSKVLLLNTKQGTVFIPTDLNDLPQGFSEAGDFDGDGEDDLVIFDYSSSKVSIAWGLKSSNSLALGDLNSYFYQPRSVSVADINLDGLDDFVVTGGNGVVPYYSAPGRKFQVGEKISLNSSQSAILVDVDFKLGLDLIVSQSDGRVFQYIQKGPPPVLASPKFSIARDGDSSDTLILTIEKVVGTSTYLISSPYFTKTVICNLPKCEIGIVNNSLSNSQTITLRAISTDRNSYLDSNFTESNLERFVSAAEKAAAELKAKQEADTKAAAEKAAADGLLTPPPTDVSCSISTAGVICSNSITITRTWNVTGSPSLDWYFALLKPAQDPNLSSSYGTRALQKKSNPGQVTDSQEFSYEKLLTFAGNNPEASVLITAIIVNGDGKFWPAVGKGTYVVLKDVKSEIDKRAAEAKAAEAKAAEAKAIVDKAAAELKAKQEAEAKAIADKAAEANRREQTISVSPFISGPIPLSASGLLIKVSSTSNLSVFAYNSTNNVCEFANGLIKTKTSGRCVIAFSQEGNSEFKPATNFILDFSIVSAAKTTTITCVKGKLTKKVTAVKPVCPAGYKKK